MVVVALVEHLPEIIMALIEAIPQIITSILEAFGPIVEGLGQVFTQAWEGIKEVFGKVGEFFTEKFNDAKEKVGEAFMSAYGDLYSVDVSSDMLGEDVKSIKTAIDVMRYGIRVGAQLHNAKRRTGSREGMPHAIGPDDGVHIMEVIGSGFGNGRCFATTKKQQAKYYDNKQIVFH